jgi:hypothetical protein
MLLFKDTTVKTVDGEGEKKGKAAPRLSAGAAFSEGFGR